MILETRDLDEEVVVATRVLARGRDMTAEECDRLIEVLTKVPESPESDYRVGGIIRS